MPDRDVTNSTPTLPPDPGQARTADDLREVMTALHSWAGAPSLRRIRQLAGTYVNPAGHQVDRLPPSTTSRVLGADPSAMSMTFVVAYVSACLRASGWSQERVEAEAERWRQSWRVVHLGGSAIDDPQRPGGARPARFRVVPRRRAAVRQLAGFTLIAAAVIGGAAGWSAVRAAVAVSTGCDNPAWKDRSSDGATGTKQGGTLLHTGPYGDCSVVSVVNDSEPLDYDCWVLNHYDNGWTHVTARSGQVQGWVWNAYLSDGGLYTPDHRCEGD